MAQHLPFWEPGSGHYGATLGQFSRNRLDESTEFVLSFADSISVQKTSVFTVADFGANDGYTSMGLMTKLIGQVRKKHGDEVSIQIIYEDQGGNDFNSLFNRLCDKSSYLQQSTNVFPFATCISFYERCVPDASCDLMITCFAVHFLEHLNGVNTKNYAFHTSIPNSEVDLLERIRDATEKSWNKFLLLRAKELKKGGLLFVFSLSAYDDYRQRPAYCQGQKLKGESNGECLTAVSKDGVGGNDVRNDLETAWRQLLDEQEITQEEFESCFGKFIIRTASEITAPFTADSSPCKDAGLQMLHHDQKFYPFNVKDAWREMRRQGSPNDAQKFFAQNLTATHRVWSETIFENSLSSTRTSERKKAILKKLYAKYEAMVLQCDPESYNTDYIVSRLVVRKQ